MLPYTLPPEDAHSHAFIDQRFYGFASRIAVDIQHTPHTLRSAATEAMLHDLWLAQRFDAGALHTSTGQPVAVRDPGLCNLGPGPDILYASLHIGRLTCRGDVALHATSGQWFTHRHHLDPRYNSTILHVALYADIWTGGLLRPDGSPLPELILCRHLDPTLCRQLQAFFIADDEKMEA